jgi:CheY-specific phosphatase CheX
VRDEIIKAIGEAVAAVFSTSLSLEAKTLTQMPALNVAHGMICSIGITGQLEGNITLGIANEAACLLVSKMLGMEFKEVTGDVTDGMGEFLNMITGGIRTRVANQLKYNFEISVPTVVRGNQIEVTKTHDTDMVEAGFGFEGGQIAVIFSYRLATAPAAPKVAAVAKPAGDLLSSLINKQ